MVRYRLNRVIGTLWVLGTLLASPVYAQSEKIVLQREWTANAEFAGDVWAAEISTARGNRFEVHEGGEVFDPVKIVRSGAAQFGVASADRVLRENERGAELVILAAATYRSPVVFIAKPGLNIKQPSDFVGRTIGVQSGTNTELVLQALLKSQGLDPKSMKIVGSGWGTQTLETGAVDVLGVFAYDEPVTLELKHYLFANPITPDDYGVHYVGTVYFAKKAVVAGHPRVVQTFMDALVEGWTKSLANPDEAINILAKNFREVRTNRAKERRSFDVGRPFFAGEDGLILYASKQRWEDMVASLRDLGKLQTFDFNESIDYSFLELASNKVNSK